jgi:hypothetical protein
MSEKLTINDETAAIDFRATDLWDNLTEEQRKQISFYLLLRYASDVRTSSSDAQAFAVVKTNEYYNKNFFMLSKHPKLLWHLVCMTGNVETQYFHEYIKFKKKTSDSKVHKILLSFYPTMKPDEIDLLAKITTPAEIKEYARKLGMDDNAIKKIL